MNIPVSRLRLINVASAHGHLDAAVGHIEAALKIMLEESKTGLPIEHTAATSESALRTTKVARENLWNFLRRMP